MTSQKRLFFCSCFILAASVTAFAQIYVGKDRSTRITFFSDAPLEKIEAYHDNSAPVFNASTGDFQIRIPMQAFKFKNDLMKEHFNENYVESDKYPYCTFKGKIDSLPALENNKDYMVLMKGKMELHGVVREVQVRGTIKKTDSQIRMFAEFFLKPADYNIKIPTLLTEKIAEQVKITFQTELVPYKKNN